MKKLLLTLILVIGVCFGLFAQKLTYQAIVRDTSQQLVVHTDVTTHLVLHFTDGSDDYDTTVNSTTNIHGLLTFLFGDRSLYTRNWEGAKITTTIWNQHDPSIRYMDSLTRPITAVPFALTVGGQSIQNYLDEHNYIADDSVRQIISDTANALRATIGTGGGVADCNAVNACVANALADDTSALHHIVDTIATHSAGNYLDTASHFGNLLNNYLTNNNYIADDSVRQIISDTADNIRSLIGDNASDISALQNRVNTFNTNICDTVMACPDIVRMRDSIQKNRDTLRTMALNQAAAVIQTVTDTLMNGNSSLHYVIDTIAQHTHANKSVLDRTQQAYRTEDSTKLANIAEGAQKNVQSDWNETDNTKDAFIQNKPSFQDSIGNYLTSNHYVTTSDLCLTIETNCTNVALKNGNNVFTGNNTLSGSNTIGDTSTTTTLQGTVTVPSGFTVGTTTSANCNDVAVNACDLLNVFDSIQRRMNNYDNAISGLQAEIDHLRDTLNNLRAAQTPSDASVSVTDVTASTATVAAVCDDGGATITDYTFHISENSDMSSPFVSASTGSNPVYRFTGLQPAHKYYVNVVATNFLGSVTSIPSNFTTLASMPTAGEQTVSPIEPAGFKVTVLGVTTGGAADAEARVCYGVMTGSDCSSVTYTCVDETITDGTYNKSVTNLQPGKTYCVKTEIATNNGDSVLTLGPTTVTVPVVAPTLGDPTVTENTGTSMTISTPVTDDGGHAMVPAQSSVCVYTNSARTEGEKCATNVTVDGSGNLVGTVDGLTPGEEYYIRVIGSNGTKKDTADAAANSNILAPELGEPVAVTPAVTSISVTGEVTNSGGADSTKVKVCAYKQSDYNDEPICGSYDTLTPTGTFNVSVDGLDMNTRYYLAVIADNGQKKDTVKTDTTTLNAGVTIISNRTDTIANCGSIDTTVTYTATVTGITPTTTYAWKVNGTDSSSVTGDTLTVRYTSAGINKVVCTVNGLTGTDTTVTQVKTAPTLGLCETCNEGTITMKTGNCTSLTWENNADASKAGTVLSIPTDSIVLRVNTDSPAGVYTFTGTNSDGCTVTRTATLGNYVAHPCTVTSLKAGTLLTGDKYANKEYGDGTQLDSVSDHEGNVYRVVQIGEGANAQCWLAENMRCTTSPSTDSTILMTMVSSYSSKSAAYYQNNKTTYGKYGVLYNWCAAVDTFYADGGQPELANATGHSSTLWSCTLPSGNRRGICPEGWHIPTDAEWSTLATNAGCTAQYGRGTGVGKLTGGCDWPSSSNTTAPGNFSYADRNSSGFSALPAGYYNVSFDFVGYHAYFWSATPNGSKTAYNRFFYYYGQYVWRSNHNRNSGFSVRCLRDESGLVINSVSNTISTSTTLGIQAQYTATQAVTGASICAYTDANCNTLASCASTVSYGSSPITATITGLNPGTSYYVKVTATTAGGTESTIAGPFSTGNAVVDTITFIANGANGSMAKQTVSRGVSATLNGNTFSHTNWEFKKWSEGCDGLGTSYADGDNIITDGNVTLYAQWHTWCTGTPYSENENGLSRIDSVRDHENHWYKVVEIGTGANKQCWLAENMRCQYSPSYTGDLQPGSSQSNYDPYCYDYTAANALSGYPQVVTDTRARGLLYNWPGAMDRTYTSSTASGNVDFPNHRGICPKGWHLPTDDEWSTLATNAGCTSPYNAGKGAANLTGCYWGNCTYCDATNTYPNNDLYSSRNNTGFSAIPVGHFAFYSNDYYIYSGGRARFWSATSSSTSTAISRSFERYVECVKRADDDDKFYGYSVRCLRDNAGVVINSVSKTACTANTLVISAAYSATQTVNTATICAYTDENCTYLAGTCAADVNIGASAITGTVTGLSPNSQYYVKVTATTNGGTASKSDGPFPTQQVAMLTITSDPSSSSVNFCGNSSVRVTYTANLAGATASSYVWNVTGGTGSSNTNYITVTASTAGTIKVTCTAAGLTDTMSTFVNSGGTAVTMTISENYSTPSVTVSTNCPTSSLVWKNTDNVTVNTGSTILKNVTSGHYTVTGTTTDGCTVTKPVYLGSSNINGCPGTPRDTNEIGSNGVITQVKDHENNSYNVVSISGFCVMKQNLRCKSSPVGNNIPSGSFTSTYTQSLIKPRYEFGIEGIQYNWRAAMDLTVSASSISAQDFPNHRGLCPKGWHLPTSSEWSAMIGSHDAGQFAAPSSSFSSSGISWEESSSSNTPGYSDDWDQNATGFSAIPVGDQNHSSGGDFAGQFALFWSATSVDSYNNSVKYLQNTNSSFGSVTQDKYNAYSIRCFRDN